VFNLAFHEKITSESAFERVRECPRTRERERERQRERERERERKESERANLAFHEKTTFESALRPLLCEFRHFRIYYCAELRVPD
jgi:hypothetical protein